MGPTHWQSQWHTISASFASATPPPESVQPPNYEDVAALQYIEALR